MKKILLILAILLLTGCNYQLLDTTWDYDKVYCYYGNKEVVYEIKSWTDYDGEQIQVKTEDGSYLFSMNQCYLRSE
jgi:outer membrane lipopolysaccharide assembly protein LptE/RlpB